MAIVHTILVGIAFISGLFIFYSDKGTVPHKSTGKVYVLMAILLAPSTYLLENKSPGIGAYDLFMSVMLVFALAALYPLLFRSRIKVWVIWHYILMLYSFLFFLMASLTYFIDTVTNWLTIFRVTEVEANVISRGICWFLPIIIGTIWIFSKKRYYENKFRRLMMRHPQKTA